MKNKLLSVVLAACLAACTTITKIEGEQLVNERLSITLTDAWNKVQGNQPFDLWTQEGVRLDTLRLWAAVKPGQPLMARSSASVPAGQTAPRLPTFAAGMSSDQLASLFEQVYAVDGSAVSITRMEPAPFAGAAGVRFEFALQRMGDDLHMLGVGWASTRNNELYAAVFVAPKLAFYPRLLPKVERAVQSARIRG